MTMQARHALMMEAAQDLEEFAFGAAWEKLKELGKLAKDEFVKGYRRGRGLPAAPEKKTKAKTAPTSKPKAKPATEPKAAPKAAPTKKRPKPAAASAAEPKKEPKPKPGLEKRKAARKARKTKKAPAAPVKDKAPQKGKQPASKTNVKTGTVEPAPNAKGKVRVMGKDGKWLYYDKQAYAKMKKKRGAKKK